MQNDNRPKQGEDFLRLQDLLQLCLAKWRWFVLSLSVILGIAVLYILTTPPVYTRSADILIKEDSKGNSMSGGELSSFADMGLFQSSTNVNNELIALQSPAAILEVVKRLHLDVTYLADGRFHKELLYGPSLPVTVSFLDLADNESAALTLRFQADNRLQFSDFVRNDESLYTDTDCQGMPGDTLRTPLGRIIIARTPYYTGEELPVIYISRSDLYATTTECIQHLTATLPDDKAAVISLSYQDVSIQRAEDVLNTLISVYNENWVKDKNQIAISTSRFINERLGVIEQELGTVDDDISSYKSEHLLPDVQAVSNMYMVQANETNTQIKELNNQLYMARYIRSYLTDSANKNQLLPANSGIEDSNLGNQINTYNEKQLQRNSLIANSSEQNPLVIDLDHALASLRSAIITSIDNQLETLKTQLRNLQQSERQSTARIAANPTQAKYLLSVERQQKVKESLYLFLLQKREENELSQAFTAYNTRLITPPTGKMIPTAPVKQNILLVAFAIGLLLPTTVIFIRESTNTTVRGKKDIESLAIPFIGEIPLAFHKKKRFALRRKKEDPATIVVKEKSRNVINEAFRVVRTNLEFMAGQNNRHQIVMITSINPGSGKTFITMNLSTSLAIKKKKVIIVDMDMRRASLSTLVESPQTGLANYLNGQADDWRSIVVHGTSDILPDVIPVGILPPNPAELLFSPRLEQLMTALRTQYDYIFIDCPPVEIVADTSIISKWADQTLFVIRTGLMEREMLTVVHDYYTAYKLNNMALLLNGTTAAYNRYGYHRYGYHYGYGNYVTN